MSEVLRPYRDLFPQIGQRVMIDDSSVVIGDVRLADDVGIWPLVVIRGDVHYVQIGARTNIQDGSMLHVTHKSSYNPDGNPLTIGEDVTVGHKVMLHGCTIGNRVLVGMGSILLDGAIVEDDVMIGAGSLVPQNKRLESGYLYLGSPVKQIRPLSDEEKAGLRYSANNYVKWKDEYMDQALASPSLEESYDLWKKAQWDGENGVTQEGDIPWIWLVNIDHLYWSRKGLHVADQKLHPHGHGWSIVNNVDQWTWE